MVHPGVHGVHKNFKLKFQDISRTFQDKNSVFPGQFIPVENHGENQEVILICLLQLYKTNLHGGKTTMLYLNLSGHELFLKKRFGTSPEKYCLTGLTAFFKETYKTDIK